ncbi:hypothetical protein PtA15_14A103 [Puccinia triticina]|uniref:Protein Zds1 C-terminal domain-containing protein n=1 Tax=Puccinia triticina TaxID=208348 RepID=A0ABY7D0X6_9BASI|nr:uncharacterized protein PtA15_14A103 [Puccinia triticina]WAQ91221.1 hypothetical protein PtA15_14A103 [Puccinia triticina]WAR62022.1 hypothetical protein PtB15_14B116 [Puccinia triticina]
MEQQKISLQSELESIRSLRRISLCHPTASSTTVESDEPNPNLFWLPARLHPEIAPQEFKAFIEEATKPENLLRRTSSALGSRRNSSDHLSPSGLSRKKSMLSQVYDPSKHPPSTLPPSPSHHRPDKAAITRGYSMSSPRNLGRGAQGLESLTINDLQRLESLVLKKPSSSNSNDPSLDSQFHHLNLNDDRIRAVISRSMTIGGSASLPSGPEFSPEQLDPEAIDDSPLISRAPGHIIRRTARTKVRKASLPGDGNGHRFPATRRTQAKSPMVNSHHPRTASTTSNDSEETVSNDLHSNRSSKELTHRSIPDSSDDLTLTIDPHHLQPAPPTGSKASNPSILDPPSEDDQSLDSTSRPDSLASNNSLLDAYTYEAVGLDDHLAPAVDTGGVDFSNLTVSPSALDFTIPHPIKYAGPTSDHPSHPTGSVQTSKPDLTSRPPSSDPAFVSPPGSSKPDSLKVLTDLAAPAPHRTTPSSDNLPSTSSSSPAISTSTTTTLSTAKSTPSSGTLSSSSPSTPVGPQSSRPPLTTTQTSPNLSNPAAGAIPPPPASVPAGSKEGKEKKRAWVKLGLSSAVSTSSKNKKGKGKDKQKSAEAESGLAAGAPSSVNPASSGGSSSTGTTAGGAVVVKKESGFLSGLFGGKSRKNESEQPDKQGASASGGSGSAGSPTKHPTPGPGGPASADTQAQQQFMNPTASGGFIKGRFMSFYRLPIHVERAVYRLSHIKLANPRRPLYEQVLISNLMFWYLGNTKQGKGRNKPNANSGSNSSASHPRGPGAKPRTKHEAERTNGKMGAASGGRANLGRKKARPGRPEGASSESGSEADERFSNAKKAPLRRPSSSSSSEDNEALNNIPRTNNTLVHNPSIPIHHHHPNLHPGK